MDETSVLDVEFEDIKIYELAWMKFEIEDQSMLNAVDGATMTILNDRLLIIGGSERPKNIYTQIYNIEEKTFMRQKPHGMIPNSRAYHSAVLYKKSIVIFGGELRLAQELHMKYCLNDTYIMDSDTCEWNQVQTSGPYITDRKGHAACLLGKFMVIHGGITSEGAILNEIFALNLNTFKWSEVFLDTTKFHNANHTMCAVYKDFDAQDLYGHISRGNKMVLHHHTEDQLLFEGLYIFGGKNREGKAVNDLYIYNTNNRPWIQIKPQLRG